MLECLKGKRLKVKYVKRLFNSAKVLTVGMMVISSLPLIPSVSAAERTLRTYASDKGDIFIGGEYIELGISKYGTFGSIASPDPSWGFHNLSDMIPGTTKYKTIGMIANENGWSSGLKSSTCDFFLPGTIDEGWSFAYKDKFGKEQIAYAASDNIGSVETSNVVSSSTQLIDLAGKKAVQTVAYLFADSTIRTLSSPDAITKETAPVAEVPETEPVTEILATIDETSTEKNTLSDDTELVDKATELSTDDKTINTAEASVPVVKAETPPSAKIKLTIVYSFDVNQKGFHTAVTVEKLVDDEMKEMCYVRGFDPDQNAGLGHFDTYQFIENTSAGARITAYGGENQAAYIFDTKDVRAKAGCYPSLSAIKYKKIFEMKKEKYMTNTANLSSTSKYEDNDIYLLFNLSDVKKAETISFAYDSLLDAYLGTVNSKLGTLPTDITKENIYTSAPQIEDIFHTFAKLSDKEKTYVDATKAEKIPELHTKSHTIIKTEVIKPIITFASSLTSNLTKEQIAKAKSYFNDFANIESKLYIEEIREEDKTLFSQYESAKKMIASAVDGKLPTISTDEKPTPSVKPAASKTTPKTSDVTQVGSYTQLAGLSAIYLLIDKKNKDAIKKYIG